MADELSTLLRANVEAMMVWLDGQRSTAGFLAGQPAVRTQILGLAQLARNGAAPEALVATDYARRLRELLTPAVEAFGYLSYYVGDSNGQSLASTFDQMVGTRAPPEVLPYVRIVMAGSTGVTRPILLDSARDTFPGQPAYNARTGRPIMFVGAPVRDDRGTPAAVLAFGIAPEDEFTHILSMSRMGETGESYAIDSGGVFLSRSRFDSTLVAVGLLEDDPMTTSVLNLVARDPGGDLTQGFPLPTTLRSLPLTTMAANAVHRTYDVTADDLGMGEDVDGYRDYRGVPVVGAWTWLPQYGFGIATEMDVAEAYQTRTAIDRVLAVVFGFLVIAALAALVINIINYKLRSDALEARQIGPYKLEKKIGEGGMGRVYRASHTLLRRPTAVKLLMAHRVDAVSVRRFEREVRHTSRLTHPNTVAIFDYGRTRQGIFYYAMEYLPGVTLQQLVDQEGALPPGRVVHVLRQAAGSLGEAHESGLIHRDVKPSNIILCERGGLFDFAKVLDFGLVRETGQTDTLAVTNPESITGTPLYISPEAILDPTKVDGRSDLYALGAVGYFMLTGEHVFKGHGPLDVLNHHLNTTPEPPSARLGTPVAPELESVLMTLLSKKPADRIPSARHLENLLDSLSERIRWTQTDARRWWEAHIRNRDSRGNWHIDFAPEPSTPSSHVRSDERTMVVDSGSRRTPTPTPTPSDDSPISAR